jgi:hypothetical protein
MVSWAGGLLSVAGGAMAGGADEKIKLLESDKKEKIEQAKLAALDKREKAHQLFLSGEGALDRTSREGILKEGQRFTSEQDEIKAAAAKEEGILNRKNRLDVEGARAKEPIETEKLYGFLTKVYGEDAAKELILAAQKNKNKPDLERQKLYNEVNTKVIKALSGDLPPTPGIIEQAAAAAEQLSGYILPGDKGVDNELQSLLAGLKKISNSEKAEKVIVPEIDTEKFKSSIPGGPEDSGTLKVDDMGDKQIDVGVEIDPISGTPISKEGGLLGTGPNLDKFRETKDQQRPYMATIDGEEVEIPLVTPNQKLMDKKHLRDGREPTPEMIEKAIAYAKENKKKGLPYFRQTPK